MARLQNNEDILSELKKINPVVKKIQNDKNKWM
jgi:signal recognition particle GTPase